MICCADQTSLQSSASRSIRVSERSISSGRRSLPRPAAPSSSALAIGACGARALSDEQLVRLAHALPEIAPGLAATAAQLAATAREAELAERHEDALFKHATELACGSAMHVASSPVSSRRAPSGSRSCSRPNRRSQCSGHRLRRSRDGWDTHRKPVVDAIRCTRERLRHVGACANARILLARRPPASICRRRRRTAPRPTIGPLTSARSPARRSQKRPFPSRYSSLPANQSSNSGVGDRRREPPERLPAARAPSVRLLRRPRTARARVHRSPDAEEVGGRAVAFIGSSGIGKTTLKALCCAAGARLVTDDVLRVEPRDGEGWCFHGTCTLRLRPAHRPTEGSCRSPR